MPTWTFTDAVSLLKPIDYIEQEWLRQSRTRHPARGTDKYTYILSKGYKPYNKDCSPSTIDWVYRMIKRKECYFG